jgi:hypothetical protein
MSRMKRIIHSELYQTWLGVTVLASVLLALVASLIIGVDAERRAAADRVKFTALSNALYEQCVQRQRYDMSSQRTRAAYLAYEREVIVEETHNRFIDDQLRAARVASAQHLIDALTDTLRKSVPAACPRYLP